MMVLIAGVLVLLTTAVGVLVAELYRRSEPASTVVPLCVCAAVMSGLSLVLLFTVWR